MIFSASRAYGSFLSTTLTAMLIASAVDRFLRKELVDRAFVVFPSPLIEPAGGTLLPSDFRPRLS